MPVCLMALRSYIWCRLVHIKQKAVLLLFSLWFPGDNSVFSLSFHSGDNILPLWSFESERTQYPFPLSSIPTFHGALRLILLLIFSSWCQIFMWVCFLFWCFWPFGHQDQFFTCFYLLCWLLMVMLMFQLQSSGFGVFTEAEEVYSFGIFS